MTLKNFKQDRQCMYNITLRRVHEAIVTVEKQYEYHLLFCVCMRVRACGYPGAWACACA
jgi:hypothetical protein